MTSEEDMVAALRALADADRGVEAPPRLEAKLRLTYRSRVRERRMKRIAAWTIAAAAVLVAMFVSYERRPRAEKVRAAQAIVEQLPVAVIAPVISSPVRRSQPVRRALPREVFTDFFPLVDAAPPIDRASWCE